MVIHEPLFDTNKIVAHYTEKDGVPVKYVCTSAIQEHADFSADVFYRETPHPTYGNRYFAIYRNMFAAGSQIMITNADCIEDLSFTMIKDSNGDYHYSQHRHDFKTIEKQMIDGGRSYVRHGGGRIYSFRVKDGELEEVGEKVGSSN